jgi:hypothetical protein
MLAHLDP